MKRLDGLDVARALAILGMFYMHTFAHTTQENLVSLLSTGRASVLFAILAGVSTMLITSRRGTAASLIQLIGRGVWLVLIGLVISFPAVGPIVILTTYGALYLLVAPLAFRLPERLIWPIAGITAIAAPMASLSMRRHLPLPDLYGEIPTIEQLGEGDIAGFFRSLFVTGLFPVLTWAPIFLFGIAAGKVIVRGKRVVRRLALIGGPIFVGGHLVSAVFLRATDFFGRYAAFHLDGAEATEFWLDAAYGVTPPDWVDWLFIYVPHSGSIVEIIASSGFAMLVIAGALWVCRARPIAVLLTPLRRLGRMSLSSYVAHIVAIGVLALCGRSLIEPGFAALNIVGPIVFAWVWFQYFRRGPLEWLVATSLRALTPRRWRPRRDLAAGPRG